MPDDNKTKTAADDGHAAIEQNPTDVQHDDQGGDNSLNTLMSSFRAQVEESHQRHGEALSDMQERLGSLGGDVDEIKQRIPTDLNGKLEGLETGLESLNERVSQLSAPSIHSETVDADQAEVAFQGDQTDSFDEEPAFDVDHAVETESDDLISMSVVNDTEPSEPEQNSTDFSTGDDDADAISSAPAALKSAAFRADTVGEEQPVQSVTLPQGVDPFDMVDNSLPGDPGSPWDQESAEALAQLYDDGEAKFEDASAETDGNDGAAMPARTPDPEADQFTSASDDDTDGVEHDSFNVASGQESYAAAGDTGTGVDREWLEAKFSEIAERIEHSLVELDPQRSAQEIDARLQSFEERVDTALQDVATRADVDGLRGAGPQGDDQFARLQSLEGTLQDVVARFTESGGMAQFADMDGAGGGNVNAEQIAEAAAARITDHLAAMAQGDNPAAISEVRGMIEEFLNEHRAGNEQTALMLDTIQQAMIRILDRLDVLEAGAGVAPADAGQDMPAASAALHEGYESGDEGDDADELTAASEGWAPPKEPEFGSDDDVVVSGQTDYQPTGEDEEAVVEIHSHDSDTADDHAAAAIEQPVENLAGSVNETADEHHVSLAGSTADQEPAPQHSAQPSPDLLSDRTDAVVVPAAASEISRDTIEKLRQNFIADAQQAKAKAAKAAVAAATDAPPSQTASRRSVLAGIQANGESNKAPGGFFASKTRRLLVGALLAVIAIQGAIFLIPNGEPQEPAPSSPAAVSEPADKNGKSGVKAKPEKSSFMVPGDGFSPGVETDVVANDLRLAMDDAENRAAGAVDLPFGLVLQQSTAKEWTQEGRPIYGRRKPAVVTPVAVNPAETLGGGRVYKAPASTSASGRAKLPPMSVGPTSLRMAAANGDPSAQFEVATRLSEGKGTKQDFKQAATWFKRSAGQGFALAQYRLGTLYERGLGVERDVNRAQMWYLRAAEQGNIRAMHNLAVLSAGQSSGTPDYATAAKWFMKAAESGLADSQFNAGVLYENGLGVSEDLVEAYKWYTLAARTGDKESLKRSQKLRSKLSIDKLGEAETSVRSFKPASVEPLINNARLAGQDWKSRHNS